MILALAGGRARERITPEERERLRTLAAQVGSAASFLVRRAETRLDLDDLRSIGIHAVWEKLKAYDAERGPLDRWAFQIALSAMRDATRLDLRDTLFRKGMRRGAAAYGRLDDRPAESDFYTDTPETDLRRLRHRTAALAGAAVVHAHVRAEEETGQVAEVWMAEEAARILREEKARLPAEQRRYLALRFWSDEEMKGIAAGMGISERTLRRRHVEVCDLLRTRLEARGVTAPVPGLSDAADLLEAETPDPDAASLRAPRDGDEPT